MALCKRGPVRQRVIYSFSNLRVLPVTISFDIALTHSLTYSLTDSLAHSLTHSFTYSLFYCHSRENPLTLAAEKGHKELVNLLLLRYALYCSINSYFLFVGLLVVRSGCNTILCRSVFQLQHTRKPVFNTTLATAIFYIFS